MFKSSSKKFSFKASISMNLQEFRHLHHSICHSSKMWRLQHMTTSSLYLLSLVTHLNSRIRPLFTKFTRMQLLNICNCWILLTLQSRQLLYLKMEEKSAWLWPEILVCTFSSTNMLTVSLTRFSIFLQAMSS
ncbi:hypothetical protein HOLleu_30654 [Holothuria leucospilota]|uniref:Uncharacterized protein n=1 Tax=Holothuria leucospilota TaxID=206669 RepID=A0A9Q1BKQ0_HOLLE|nr:hypothetical protein HOLleu_30654 [Holothuria leucospilota]